MEIRTNNTPRPVLYWHELTEAQQKEMSDRNESKEDAFFIYKKQPYALSQFMRIDKNAPEDMQDWHGYASDTFFSGILIRLSEDGEAVTVAQYFS